MQTIDSILLQIRAERPCSKVQLRRYISDIPIAPLGARQRPQRYPDDSAARILAHLGILRDANGNAVKPSMYDGNYTLVEAHRGPLSKSKLAQLQNGVVSLAKLKRIRAASRKKARAAK